VYIFLFVCRLILELVDSVNEDRQLCSIWPNTVDMLSYTDFPPGPGPGPG
jgi:hypothetical protein